MELKKKQIFLVFLVVAITLISFLFLVNAAWWDSTYGSRTEINISEGLSVNIAIPFVLNFTTVNITEFENFRIILNDTVILPMEIVNDNEVWFNTTIEVGQDNTANIKLYNQSGTNSSYLPSQVWSDFTHVFHFDSGSNLTNEVTGLEMSQSSASGENDFLQNATVNCPFGTCWRHSGPSWMIPNARDNITLETDEGWSASLWVNITSLNDNIGFWGEGFRLWYDTINNRLEYKCQAGGEDGLSNAFPNVSRTYGTEVLHLLYLVQGSDNNLTSYFVYDMGGTPNFTVSSKITTITGPCNITTVGHTAEAGISDLYGFIDEFRISNNSNITIHDVNATFHQGYKNYAQLSGDWESSGVDITVTLESPDDNNSTNNPDVNFTCSAVASTSAANIQNVTYYLWDSDGAVEASVFRDLFSMGNGSTPHSTYVNDANSVAFWSLNTTSLYGGNYTEDVNSFNASISGNPTNVSGIFTGENATRFFGSADRLLVNNNTFVNLTNHSWTVSAWVKLSGKEADQPFFSQSSAAYSLGMWYRSSTDTWSLAMYDTTWRYVDFDETADLDVWTHVVAQWNDAKRMKIFVNGVEGTDDHFTNNPRLSNLQIYIGYFTAPTGDNRYFNGSIAHVAIWNRTLTASEIETLYNSYGLSSSANESFLQTSIPDDNYDWNCLFMNSTGTASEFATSNYSITVDTVTPTVSIILESNVYSTTSVDLNYTFVDNNPDSCTYSLDNGLTNSSFTNCGTNATITANNGFNTVTVYVEDTVGQIGNTTQDFSVVSLLTEFNNTNVLETTIQDYAIEIANGSATVESAIFTYNSTEYSTTSTHSNGTSYFLNTSVSLPLVEVRETGKEFWWNLTLSSGSDYVNLYSTRRNQTITQMYIGNCTDGISTTQTLNFTIKDEETPTLHLNATDIEAEFEIWNRTDTLLRTFNFDIATNTTPSLNTSNFAFCIDPTWAFLTSDYIIQYGLDEYSTREYHGDNSNLNSTVTLIDLFLADEDETDIITINVEDENGNELEGVVVEAHKKDVGSGNFTIVDVQETDPTGVATFNLIRGDNYYKFIFKIDGVIRLETNEFKLTETEYFFTITIGGPTNLDILEDIYSISETLTFNESGCNNVVFTWDDNDDVADSFRLIVSNVSYLNDTVVTYDQSSTNTTGEMTFRLGNASCFSYSGRFLARSYVVTTADEEQHILNSLAIEITKIIDRFPLDERKDGALFGLIVITTMFGIGMVSQNPSIYVGLGVISLWLMTLIDLIPLTGAAIISIIFIGLIFVRYLKT